jgi:hypothetical protein
MATAETSAGGTVADPDSTTDQAVAPEAPGLFTRDVPTAPAPVAPPVLDPEFWGPEEVARERRRTTQVPVAPSAPDSSDRAATSGMATGVAASSIAAGADNDRYEARKVRRIVRHVSPWSVFKVSVLFYACMWVVFLIAGVLLWNVAQRTGVITNIEKFYAKSTGEQFHEIDGRGVFRSAAFVGAALAVATTGLTVLMSVLFNLITDLVGGIRVSVIELENRRPRRR